MAFGAGGGVLTFGDFNADENGRHLRVLDAFLISNNLVYFCMMQEMRFQGHYVQNPRRSRYIGRGRLS